VTGALLGIGAALCAVLGVTLLVRALAARDERRRRRRLALWIDDSERHRAWRECEEDR
jgi:hypothetical protein